MLRRVGIAGLIVLVVGAIAAAVLAPMSETSNKSSHPVVTRYFAAKVPVDEFYGLSTNLSCEIDTNFADPPHVPINEAYCESISASQSVVLHTTGSAVICHGPNCLSNAGIGTPIRNVNQGEASKYFTCFVSSSSVTCSARSGHGFVIDRRGVRLIHR